MLKLYMLQEEAKLLTLPKLRKRLEKLNKFKLLYNKFVTLFDL